MESEGAFPLSAKIREKYPRAATFIDIMFSSQLQNSEAMSQYSRITGLSRSQIEMVFLSNSPDELVGDEFFDGGYLVGLGWYGYEQAEYYQEWDGFNGKPWNSVSAGRTPKIKQRDYWDSWINESLFDELEQQLVTEEENENSIWLISSHAAATKLQILEIIGHEFVHYGQRLTDGGLFSDTRSWDNGAEWEMRLFGHSWGYRGHFGPDLGGIGYEGLVRRLENDFYVNDPILLGFTYSASQSVSITRYLIPKFGEFFTGNPFQTFNFQPLIPKSDED